MKLVLLCAVLASVANCILGARILAIFPFPGKSHYIFLSSVTKALTDKGHEVVEYSPFKPSKPIPNHKHVEIHTSFEKNIKSLSYEEFIEIANSRLTKVFLGFMPVWWMTRAVCEETFQHENIRKLLNSNERFDLVMVESSFGQESMLVFGHRFGVPTINLQGFSAWSANNMDAGNALSIASVPELSVMVPEKERMSFIERCLNLVGTIVTLSAYYLYHLPTQETVIKEHYGRDAPPLLDMVRNVSLFLVNGHPAVGYVPPFTPNIVPIAGITINTNKERFTLPKDIQKFMDEAKDGVIYFSLGTVVPAHALPMERLQIFVNVFKKLPQKVLWKIELESIPNLSTNVMLKNWVPQPGVLAHPNLALFMTHGGLFSQQEAIHSGVPTVGIPFFGDQPYNVKFSEHRGFGVKLDFSTLSEETVFTALSTVLNNPKYKENAQRQSKIFRDRPQKVSDSLVFWVEYVVRHAGAAHLRPASAHMPWYQLALLDVLAVVLVIVAAIIVTLYLVIKNILSFIFGKKKSQQISSSKKKN